MYSAIPKVSPLSVPRQRLHCTPDEAHRLIEAAGQRGRQRHRDRTMVLLNYRHGMRAIEVCTLLWRQIDFAKGRLHVRRQKLGNDSMHTLAADELDSLLELRRTGQEPWVFGSERGGHVSPDMLARVIKAAAALANVPEEVAHPHALRHAAGYYLINHGTELRLVQDFLGHRNIQNTVAYTALTRGRMAGVRVR